MTEISDRFWKSVRKEGYGDCWVWVGRTSGSRVAYGRYCALGYEWRCHRFVWTVEIGRIPKGLCVLHKCDNGLCVRPDHLFLGTRADNNADRDRKGRSFWQKNRPEAEKILAKARKLRHANPKQGETLNL